MSVKRKIYSKIKNSIEKIWRVVLRYTGDEVSYIYDEEFANKPWRDKGYTKEFKDIVFEMYEPESIVDVGCGTGDFLKPFLDEGTNILGIDGSKNCFENRKIPEEKLLVRDLRFESLNIGNFDVCLCMEVAEHIEEKYSNRLIKVVTEASKNVIFTAATPGQGGVDHVNEKPREWWIEKFRNENFYYMEEKTKVFSDSLSEIENDKEHDRKSIKNYEKNIMVFEGK